MSQRCSLNNNIPYFDYVELRWMEDAPEYLRRVRIVNVCVRGTYSPLRRRLDQLPEVFGVKPVWYRLRFPLISSTYELDNTSWPLSVPNGAKGLA